MNQPPIEHTVTPTTPTEIALLDRIRQLTRQLWEAGRFANTADGFPLDPNSVPVSVQDFSPTLRLAAVAKAKIEPLGLRIEARTHGPMKTGVANYMTDRELSLMNPYAEVTLLTEIHKRVIRQAAELLKQK